MNLGDMPDDVLIRLMNTSSPRDVARAKRLNKRFHQIVEQYNLGKPCVKEFCIESRVSQVSPSKVGRLRLGAVTSAPKRRTVVTMRREKGIKRVERVEESSCSSDSTTSFVQENLKKVVLGEKLSFDGVTLDEDFYNMLIAKPNSLKQVTTVALSLCHIRLSWTQFAELLARMTVKRLYLDFCTFNASLISDKVLMSLPHLEILQIQPRYPCFLNELTDETLIHWATNGKVPKKILLRSGIGCRISVEGIRVLMTSALLDPSSVPIDWDFGLLFDPTNAESVLLSFVLSPGWQVNISDDLRSRRIHLKRQNCALQFCIPAPFPTGPHSAANV
ncbi:unnamed protein product [Caenorhabditis sp. 36 PRJEB53466]|nr:unnamed protein product [Caenorhabditis sp. 36 PRJEB53466]